MGTSGAEERAPSGEPKTPSGKNRRLVLIGVLALLVLAVAGGGLWYFLTPHKLDVWHKATVSYADGCKADCKALRAIGLAHGGADPNQRAVLAYNPKIDDATAQWGDCLQSALTCLHNQKQKNATVLNSCVAASQCPTACKERYSAQTGAQLAQAKAAFFTVFLNKDAVCRPEDGG